MQGNGASLGEDDMSQESVRAYLRETSLEADAVVHRPQEINLTELLYLSGLEQPFRNPRFNTAT